jgi:hypothetical protein
MKQRLASILDCRTTGADRPNARREVERQLEAEASPGARVAAAAWTVETTPRAFLDRHRTGARFSALPHDVAERGLRELSDWAVATFGSLETVFSEPRRLELRFFRFR